jgi:hypothetical protein
VPRLEPASDQRPGVRPVKDHGTARQVLGFSTSGELVPRAASPLPPARISPAGRRPISECSPILPPLLCAAGAAYEMAQSGVVSCPLSIRPAALVLPRPE